MTENWGLDIAMGQDSCELRIFLGKSKLFLVVFTYYYRTGVRKLELVGWPFVLEI